MFMTINLTKLVFATKNKNKLSEVKNMLENSNIEIVGIEGEFDPEETGATFEENAFIKAFEAAKITNLPALGDDSGLMVDALDGRPGVYSSRYEKTDEKRINKLLQELEHTKQAARSARFVCSMVIALPSGEKVFSTTQNCEGEIAFLPSGSEGFGYDPIFYLPEKNATMAELTMEEKNKLSHRAKALGKTLEWLISGKNN
ncbi:MAG TPA: RdgB/HAM1 family non-canonical purine NTP pyrophosphatase [Candidatus Gastranaerophilales bacterium]|nr:RdgB/HAM1 family non-canonical purine NTP pyrophosphatase [Candidatus Gastranaerophilales bacterium]